MSRDDLLQLAWQKLVDFVQSTDNEIAPVKVLADGFPLPNYDRGPSSRANALALILQQFCRSMIKGPTPA